MEDPKVRITVYIPATLDARFNWLVWDPVLRRPRYGEKTRIITQLLSEWVSQMEKTYGKQPNDPGQSNSDPSAPAAR